MSPYVAEFLGTLLLVTYGNGAVANVVLARTKGHGGGWIVITAGWGLAVFVGVFCAQPFSGAHINPVVTFAFFLMGRLDARTAAVYVLGQLTGAVLFCLPLLAWGEMGRSVAFGATLPGKIYPLRAVLWGEIWTTFCLIRLLCVFIGFRQLRRFTPLMIPVLYAIMSYWEAPVSGTSTNPARSLGPAIISGQWHGWWIYWVGPVIGTLLAMLVCNALALKVEVAKLYHFDTDRSGLLRRTPKNAGGGA